MKERADMRRRFVGVDPQNEIMIKCVMKSSERILKLIDLNRAVSTTQIVKALEPRGVEKDDVIRLLGKLIYEGEIVPVGGLPRTGIFYKRKGTKGFGIPLSRDTRDARGNNKSQAAILELLSNIEFDGVWTVSRLADETGYHKNTVRKALLALELKGLAFRKAYPSGDFSRGRPADLWSDVQFEDVSRDNGRNPSPPDETVELDWG